MTELKIDLWLQPEEIGKETVCWIASEGVYREINQGEDLPPKEVFEIRVMLPTGESRSWTMNETSQRALATAYGQDTSKWLNKPVAMFSVLQNVFGNNKQVIYARIPTAELLEKFGMNPFMPKPT